MFSQTSPDLPNQRYTELIQARSRERLVRRLLRQRRVERRPAHRTAVPRPSVRPTVTEQVELACPAQQA